MIIQAIEAIKNWNSFTFTQKRFACKQNPVIFAEMVIRPYVNGWRSFTAKHQDYMLSNVLKYPRNVIHVPVEHAKSTWFSLVFPLWALIHDRNLRIGIVSSSLTQAKKFLTSIKWHIENNQTFKNFFPNIRPDRDLYWTKTEIYLERDSNKQSKDPSIVATGTGGAILGARLDILIGDDICDLNNSSTEANRENIQNWWNEIIDSRIVEDGRVILLGTLQNKNDLLCYLSESLEYNYVHLKGLIENEDGTLEALWQDQWSVERLLRKKKTIGVKSFNKTIQNDRFSTEDSSLNIDWLRFYDGYRNISLPKERYLKYYIGVDPAIADDKPSAIKKKLDEFALVVIAHDKRTNFMYLIDYFEDHLTFPEQIKKIDFYYQKYETMVRKIGIENVAYQKSLKQQTQILKSMPPVVAVNVGTQSKAARIDTFSVYAETGQFYVSKNHTKFIDRWQEYEPHGKSPNLLDACVVASIMIKGNVKKGNSEAKKLLKNAILGGVE